ncbi:MAG: hypothetical protein HYV06_03155 [Deltaproteobacteria bacterium]|nr:hypothetical protein [Deltaproteobacteria bacterium]
MTIRFPSLTAVLLGGCIALSLLSGCATVDRKIQLSYAPIERPFGQQSGDIVVSRAEPPAPARNSRGEWIIGSINNVHDVRQADVLSNRSLGEWITDALLLELKHAGFSVTYAPSLPANAPRGIVISDINAFLNVKQGTVSDETRHELKFNADVFQNGVKAKTFTVASRDGKTLPLSASTEELERTMLQSLQDAMRQIIPEIVALTGKK